MEATDVDINAIPLSRYSVVFKDMESHYNTLLNTIPGVVYTLDEKGHFTYISSTSEEVLGYSLNDIIGRHFSYIIYPDDVCMVSREHILPRFAGVTTGGDKAPKLFDERRSLERKTSGLNVRLRFKSSQVYTKSQSSLDDRVIKCRVNSSGQYIKKKGEMCFCGTVGFIFDVITDNSMAGTLESRKRYNTLDLLANALSHAFSNIFTGIYGNLQLMEMQLDGKSELDGNIEAIKNSVENAVSLIKQVTESLSESVPGDSTKFLCDLIADVAQDSFEKTGHTFELKSEGDIWTVEPELDYINHVFRSVFFHISCAAGTHTVINGVISNHLETSDYRFPRLDCRYIKVAISFSLEGSTSIGNCTVLKGHTRALDKIASMALSYALLKKIGGVVEVSDDGDGAIVSMYLPSKIKVTFED